jgi:hypothetical protein
MKDKVFIIVGIAVFLAIVLSPFVYNAVTSANTQVPELGLPPNGATECVMDKAYMRAFHMDLLNQWRDEVVREESRDFVVESTGQTVKKSLTLTCLECHSNKAEFCDACHTYMAVAPYCWDCHVVPVETKEAE